MFKLRRNQILKLLISLILISYEGVASAASWEVDSTNVEVRRDSIHGQHLYITFEKGAVTMMRASLPNNWEVSEARAIDGGIALFVKGRSAMCYSPSSFGRVYSEVMVLSKDQNLEKAAVWEKYQGKCE